MTDETPEGNKFLSPNCMLMWSVHQHILLKWNMYTIFKYDMFNVPEGKRGFLQWFVPLDHPFTNTVMMWLENELQQFVIEPSEMLPGTDIEVVAVGIHEYSGLEPYLEREQAEAVAHHAMEQFMAKVERMRKDRDE